MAPWLRGFVRACHSSASSGGYDVTNDDDIDDPTDDLVWNESWGGGTSKTLTYDHAGNMIEDGTFRYVYDAWNRLVSVKAAEDSGAVTIQASEFDAIGRRIKKTVTNAGDYDQTVLFYYDGKSILETRLVGDPANAYQQFIHGLHYIDEIVMMRVKGKGDVYVHQDANWNVIGTTDLGRHVVERNVYTPYGELTVHQDTGFGDRDGDGDVDSTDKGTVGVTCTGTVTGSCRILDLDFDGDYDSTDAGLFNSLPQGTQRRPGRPSTATSQPFAHQGLLIEPELAQYQNRARQYDPGKRQFTCRDPLTASLVGTGYGDGLNLYKYLRQSPVLFADPDGLLATRLSPPSPNPPFNNWIFSLNIVYWGTRAADFGGVASRAILDRWNANLNGGLPHSVYTYNGRCRGCAFATFSLKTKVFSSPTCDSHTGAGTFYPPYYFGGDCATSALVTTGSTISVWMRPSDGQALGAGGMTNVLGGNYIWIAVQDINPTSSWFKFTAAHEIGHSLGNNHDLNGNSYCSSADIMDYDADHATAVASCCNIYTALRFHGIRTHSTKPCCGPTDPLYRCTSTTSGGSGKGESDASPVVTRPTVRDPV